MRQGVSSTDIRGGRSRCPTQACDPLTDPTRSLAPFRRGKPVVVFLGSIPITGGEGFHRGADHRRAWRPVTRDSAGIDSSHVCGEPDCHR